jgi:hypothetical protein
MKKLLLFAAVAGLGLVSASPPDKGPENGPREARRHYPPCSRTVTDSCIQLHERGVRARYHREHREHAADHHRDHRDHAADHRPPHHRVAMAARAGREVGCRCHPPRRRLAQRIRRAGERG